MEIIKPLFFCKLLGLVAAFAHAPVSAYADGLMRRTYDIIPVAAYGLAFVTLVPCIFFAIVYGSALERYSVRAQAVNALFLLAHVLVGVYQWGIYHRPGLAISVSVLYLLLLAVKPIQHKLQNR